MPGGGPVVDFGAIPGGGVVFRPFVSVFCSCSFCGRIKSLPNFCKLAISFALLPVCSFFGACVALTGLVVVSGGAPFDGGGCVAPPAIWFHAGFDVLDVGAGCVDLV